MHTPIILNDLNLSFSHKICFDAFHAQILSGDRIALIGSNGSGKTSLLKILMGELVPTHGFISKPSEALIAYVPQIIESIDRSGGERFNDAFHHALAGNPDILLLDEPTNHLDLKNKRALIRQCEHYTGTLLVVSHDVTFLRECIHVFWHFNQGQIRIFKGHYDDYMNQIQLQGKALQEQIASLSRQKKDMHGNLMKEQERAAKSRTKGEKSIKQKK